MSPRCVPGCLMRRRCVCQAPRAVSLSPGAVLMAIATVPAPTGLRLHAVGCAAFPQVHQLRVRGPQGTCSGRLQVPRTECCGEIRKWCWGGRTVLCLVRASSPGPHPSDPSSSARCSRVPRAPHTGIQTRVQTLLLHRDQGTGGCQRGGGGDKGQSGGRVGLCPSGWSHAKQGTVWRGRAVTAPPVPCRSSRAPCLAAWRGARGGPRSWARCSQGCWSAVLSAASSLAGPPSSTSSRAWATLGSGASPRPSSTPTGRCIPVWSQCHHPHRC